MTALVVLLLGQRSYSQQPPGREGIDPARMERIIEERLFPMKITLEVVDEEGHSVEGAVARVGVESMVHPRGVNLFEGVTDEKGRFAVEARGTGFQWMAVTKEGYYMSKPDYKWDPLLNSDPAILREKGFRPWNPIIRVELKRISDPIPLYVFPFGCAQSDFGVPPAVATDLGYDLFIGDWVSPFGEGEVADVEMRFLGCYESANKNWGKAWLSFPNPGDGMCPLERLEETASILKFPRKAPVDGYEVTQFHEERIIDSDGGPPNYGILKEEEEQNRKPGAYFIRIRCKRDEAGKVVSCYYGKIVTPITMHSTHPFSNKPALTFGYYLNPTPNDRNLEFDQKHNLMEKCEIPARNIAP